MGSSIVATPDLRDVVFEVPVEVIFSTTPFARIGSGERSA
jgi:hypothetical protein